MTDHTNILDLQPGQSQEEKVKILFDYLRKERPTIEQMNTIEAEFLQALQEKGTSSLAMEEKVGALQFLSGKEERARRAMLGW